MPLINPGAMNPQSAFLIQLGSSLMGNLEDPGAAFGGGISSGAQAFQQMMEYQQQQQRQQQQDAAAASQRTFTNNLATNQNTRAQEGHAANMAANDADVATRQAAAATRTSATEMLGAQGLDTSVLTPETILELAEDQVTGNVIPAAFQRRYGANAQAAMDAMATGGNADATGMQFDPSYEIFASEQQKAADEADISKFRKEQGIRVSGQKELATFSHGLASETEEKNLPQPEGQMSPNVVAGEVQDFYTQALEGMAVQQGKPLSQLSIIDKERAKDVATQMAFATKSRASIPDALLGQFDGAMNRGDDVLVTETANRFEETYGVDASIQYLISVGYEREQAEVMMGVRIPLPVTSGVDPAGIDPAILRMIQ